MAYEPPPGYELCKDGNCIRPAKEDKAGANWRCFESGDCKGPDCKCYLAAVAPGEKQLRILAEQGAADYKRAFTPPPGWSLVCVCMKKVQGKKQDDGWDVREKPGWIAPKGYKLKDDCPCLVPYEDQRRKEHWRCQEADDDRKSCYLVGVAPGEKQLHLFAQPQGQFPQRDIPPGWGIFCVCLDRA
jgi:hypothetical protein